MRPARPLLALVALVPLGAGGVLWLRASPEPGAPLVAPDPSASAALARPSAELLPVASSASPGAARRAPLAAPGAASAVAPVVVERRIQRGTPCAFQLSEKGPRDVEPPAAWREGRKVLRTICTLRVRADLPAFEVAFESAPGEEQLATVEIRAPGAEPQRFPGQLYQALFGDESIPVEMMDMNFDGYLDLRFLRSAGTDGCRFDTFLLYRPAPGRFGSFAPNDSLSEICRATPDPRRRRIKGSGYFSGDSPALDGGLQRPGEPGLYRWERDQLTPTLN